MKQIILLLMCLCAFVNGYAQSESYESTITLTLGGSYGYFSGTKDFTKVYMNNIYPYGGVCAVGDGSIFLVGRYDKIQTTGSSIVEVLPIDGKADWRQEFASIGLRYLHPRTRMYYDLLYVFMQASESISTQPVEIAELTTSATIKDRGWGMALGLSPRLVGPIGLFFEMRYYMMFRDGKTADGNSVRNVGGLFVCGGLTLTLQ